MLDIIFLYNFFLDNTDHSPKKLKKLSPNDAPEVRTATSSQQHSPSTSGLHDYVTFITQQRVRFATLFKIIALGTYLLATVTTMRSFDSLDELY